MQPRVLFRTHYQVDEPAIIEFLVKLCSSPVQSAYNETVAAKLTKQIKDFNIAAAGYAVDLAQGLGVVDKNNVWSDKGHLVNLLAQVSGDPIDAQLHLNSYERLLHFCLFLEADGAMLLSIAQHIIDHQSIPDHQDDWNSLATRLFGEIYRKYLSMAGTTSDRVALRTEADRIVRKGYAGKSGTHKMFIHLQTLYRLGLLDRAPSGAARRYIVARGGAAESMQILVKEIADFYTLERVIRERKLVEIANRVLRIGGSIEDSWSTDTVFPKLITFYRTIMSTGLPLCPLSALGHAVQIRFLVDDSKLLSYSRLLEVLREAQSANLGDIRFHVDRAGEPAFLKLSDRIVRSYSNTDDTDLR